MRWYHRVAKAFGPPAGVLDRKVTDVRATECPRCGMRNEEGQTRLVDPAGRWSVCVRCGLPIERKQS